MDNYQLAQKFADLESGFQRLLGEYQQLVARQVSLAARMDKVYSVLYRAKFIADERSFCKKCGVVIDYPDNHVCNIEAEGR